jgi:hypothetical protein
MHIDDPLVLLADWSPQAPVNPADVPGLADIEGLFGSDPVDPWLRAEVATLVATGDLFNCFAAVGMIISWWKPQDISNLQWLDTPVANTPPGRAWAVCTSLPTHITDRAFRSWIAASLIIRRDVEAMEELAKAGEVDRAELWRHTIHQEWRELNAVCVAMSLTDRALQMARTLRRVERVVARIL